jgi:hypothetical protein
VKTRPLLAMTARSSQAVGLLVVAWVATRKLTPAELGFFFSFLSFGALVQLADFGLSYAALQTGGRLAGTGRLHELPGLALFIGRWNLLTSLLASVVATGLGWATFSTGNPAAPKLEVAWRGPWVGFIISVFVFQLSLPGISLREGSGRVARMWWLRLAQEWFGTVACLVALGCGAGLWCLVAYTTAKAIVAGLWLRIGEQLSRGAPIPVHPLRQWMLEVWPFQWKIGLSVLSGFLIFRAFSPIILLTHGPVAAGQFGLAISIMNLLIAITSAWPMSHAPRYSSLIAGGRIGELRREFPSLLLASTTFAIMTAAVSAFVLWWAREKGFVFALRLADPFTNSVILATAVVHHVVLCYAMFLRAEGREPLLIPSVAGGVFNISVIWLTARIGTVRDVALVNLILAIGGIPIVLLLFRSRNRKTAPELTGGTSHP